MWQEEIAMYCEECQMRLWKAGEVAPAGVYVRVDDQSYRTVVLESEGYLPATYDGCVALYCVSACRCKMPATREQCAARVNCEVAQST